MQDVALVKKLWMARLPLFLLLSVLVTFSVALASIPVSWVTLGHDDFTITGELLRCSDCPAGLQGKWYRDIAKSDLCEPVKEGMEGLCRLLEDLGTAGMLFIVGEVIAVVGLAAWFGLIIAKIWGIYDHKWVLLSVSGAAVCLQALSLLLWVLVSKAVYSDCTNLQFDNQRPQVCISAGPSLALAAVLLSCCSFSLLLFTWYRCSSQQPPPAAASTTSVRFTFGNIADLSDRQI